MSDPEYRPIRIDVRGAVLALLQQSDQWVSRREIIEFLEATGVPVPPQISVVLHNMVRKGWIKRGKTVEGGYIRWYLNEAQIPPGKPEA